MTHDLGITCASSLHAESATIDGVAGVFLPLVSVETDGIVVYIADTHVRASTSGPAGYIMEPATGQATYIDLASMIADNAVYGGASGAFLIALTTDGHIDTTYPLSIGTNNVCVNGYQCNLNNGSGIRSRSGVNNEGGG